MVQSARDCRLYISSCTICAHSKSSGAKLGVYLDQCLSQLLVIVFIVDLPLSRECNSILLVVNRLTKMAYFLLNKGTCLLQPQWMFILFLCKRLLESMAFQTTLFKIEGCNSLCRFGKKSTKNNYKYIPQKCPAD